MVLVRGVVVLVFVGCAAATSSPSVTSASAPRAKVQVVRAEGLPPERVSAIFGPAAAPIEHCMPAGSRGKIEVRVQSRGGALDVAVVPGASLDPRARACALDALSSVYLEETATNAGTPAVPPSGFTSLLMVSW